MSDRRPFTKFLRHGLVGLWTSSLLIAPSLALPVYQGDGSANVEGLRTGANDAIRVTGERAAVMWHSFNVVNGERFRIEGQANQVILNRVVGPDPSQIGGLIESGPRFILSNPNGISVQGTGRIVAPSMVLTTSGINVTDWLNRTGIYQDKPDNYLNISLGKLWVNGC